MGGVLKPKSTPFMVLGCRLCGFRGVAPTISFQNASQVVRLAQGFNYHPLSSISARATPASKLSLCIAVWEWRDVVGSFGEGSPLQIWSGLSRARAAVACCMLAARTPLLWALPAGWATALVRLVDHSRVGRPLSWLYACTIQ